MDAPPPHVDPPYVYAATDYRPRGAQELALCEKASRFDWLYFSMPVALMVGTIALDSQYLKHQNDQERLPDGRIVRDATALPYLGGGLVGFAWGWTLGSFHMALPKCSPDWVTSAPPEGGVRTTWQLAVAFTMLAAATAPIVVGTETGPVPIGWLDGQRSMRLVFAGIGGAAGALLPYLVPPRTWSAARELENIRAGTTPDGKGAFFSYTARF